MADAFANAAIGNKIVINSGGTLHVKSGAVASDASIRGGHLSLFQGGIAKNALISSGTMCVESGGTSINTLISGGSIWVKSNGSAMGIDIEAGTASIQGVASDVKVNGSICCANIYGIASDIIVYNSGRVINSNAIVSTVKVLSGGTARTCSNGILSGIMIESNGIVWIDEYGSARNVVLNSAGSMILNNGYARVDSITINNGGKLYVRSGTANEISLQSGGFLEVMRPGSAFKVRNNEGTVSQVSGGYITYAAIEVSGNYTVTSEENLFFKNDADIHVINGGILYEGPMYDGHLTVDSGGKVQNFSVLNGLIDVLDGGNAQYITISGGAMNISSGGLGRDFIIRNGIITVSSGGSISNVSVKLNGKLSLEKGAFFSKVTLDKGTVYINDEFNVSDFKGTGTFILNKNVSVSQIKAMAGINYIINSGAVVDSAIVSSNGSIIVNNKGIAGKINVSQGGYVNLCSGAILSSAELYSGGTICLDRMNSTSNFGPITLHGSGIYGVSSRSTYSGFYEKAGLLTYNNYIPYVIVSNRAKLLLASNASAGKVILESGGSMELHGNVNELVNNAGIWTGDRSHIVQSGSFFPSDIQISSGGYAEIYQNVPVTSAYIYKAGMNVVKGLVSNAYIAGNAEVLSSGSVQKLIIREGNVSIHDGGIVDSIDAARLLLSNYNIAVGSKGVVHSVVMAGSGKASYCNLFVSNGGKVSNVELIKGSTYVYSGASIDGMVIGSSGSVDIFEGGVVKNITVNMGGHLYVRENAQALNVKENGGMVNVVSGGTISYAANFIESLTVKDRDFTIHSGMTIGSFWMNGAGELQIDGGSIGAFYASEGSGGAAADIYVFNGGKIDRAYIKGRHRLFISSGGVVSIGASKFWSSGDIYLYSGGSVDIDSNAICSMTVMPGAIARNYSLAYLQVNNGASASNIITSNLHIISGASIENISILKNITVPPSAVLISAKISSGVTLTVTSGGFASKPVVSVGAHLVVSSGGTARDIIQEGGEIIFSSGAAYTAAPRVFSGITFYNKNNNLNIYSGTSLVSCVFCNSGGTKEATLNISSGAVVVGAKMDSWWTAIVSSGGIMSGCSIVDQRQIDSKNGAIVNDTYYVGSSINFFGEYISKLILNNTSITQSLCVRNAVIDEANANCAYVVLSSGGSINKLNMSAGNIVVCKNGILNSISVNPGIHLSVCSGGTANNIIENGGVVADDNALDDYGINHGMHFVSNYISSTILRGSMTIHEHTTAGHVNLISSGAKIIIYSNGVASDIQQVKGLTHIKEGGTATIVVSGGNVKVENDGKAFIAIMTSGRPVSSECNGHIQYIALPPVILNSSLTIDQGALSEVTINSGGKLTLQNNAHLESATVNNKGTLCILSNAGIAASNIVMNSGGRLDISGGGTIKSLTVNNTYVVLFSSVPGDHVYLDNVIVNSGGQVDLTGMTIGQAQINIGGKLALSKTVVDGKIVQSGGELKIYDSGFYGYSNSIEPNIVRDITVSNSVTIYSNCIASNIIISRGGILDVREGGKTVNITISSGGILSAYNVRGAILYSGGIFKVRALTIKDKCYGSNFILNSGGRLLISFRYNIKGITLNSGSILEVPYGGFASRVIENGGYLHTLYNSTYTIASHVASDISLSSTSMTVHSGTTANSIYVNRGATLEIYSSGIANHVTINEGGLMEIEANGVASGISIYSSGAARVMRNGICNGVFINSGGVFYIYDSGAANNVVISNGGRMKMYNVTEAENVTIKDGGQIIISGQAHLNGKMYYGSQVITSC